MYLKSRLHYALFLWVFLAVYTSYSQAVPVNKARQQWIDSTYQSLSDAQKIGQLFVVMIQSKASEKELKLFEEELKRAIN